MLVEEEDVVGGADVGGVFADGDGRAGVEVELGAGLDDPAGGGELGVDRVAGDLLGVLVGGRGFGGGHG